MKILLTLFAMAIASMLYAQTPNPWLDDMNSVSQPGDQWRLITGQANTGSHNGEMCFNLVGTYLDDEFYSFESDTLDLSSWNQVDVQFTIASSLRSQDQLGFYYYDSATSSWSGYDISGLVGTYTVTIPTTAVLLSFDLSTFSNGNLNGKYAHIDQIILSDPFVTLPVELVYFEGEEIDYINHLEWMTASEANSDVFEIEWSTDAIQWLLIGDVKAAGNSVSSNYYTFNHEDFRKGTVNYYRLKQIDYDGKEEIYGPIAIENRIVEKKIVKYVNLMGQEVNPLYTTGLVLIVFEDGSTSKLIR